MSIYLWSSEPSKIYVWSSEVSAVYVGTEKVRPTFKLQKIFDFSTSDKHWFTQYTSAYNWLKIDTTNQRCCNNSNGYGSFYKIVNYKRCWQRIKAKANVSSWFSCICWIWRNYAPSSWINCNLWYSWTNMFVWVKWQSSYDDGIPMPSWFDASQYHYYDIIWDNGNVTAKLLDLNENVLWSKSYTASETNLKYIWFSWWYGSSTRWFEIKEYRLAYEE